MILFERKNTQIVR